MKRIKQFLCAVLCIFLLLTSCAPSYNDTEKPQSTSDNASSLTDTPESTDSPSISPTPTPDPAPFDEYLVSKWDFEGSNPLSDKASGGTSNESVSLSGSATVRGGILTVYGGKSSFASIAGSDTYDLKNKTVVFKAKINNDFDDGYKNNITGLLSKESGYDVYFSNVENGRLSQFRYFHNGSRPYFISESKTTEDEWRVYAVTVEYTEPNGAEIRFYKSKGEDVKSASDLELIHSKTVSNADADFLTGSDPIILGKRFDHTEESRALKSDFSEIRVYSVALKPEELAEIDLTSALDASLGELSWLIEYAEALTPSARRNESDIKRLKNAISAAKEMAENSDISSIKAAAKLLLYEISLMTPRFITDSIGSLTLMPYNNPELDVPIATGLHAYPGFYDIDGDGDMDFVSSGISLSYGGQSGGSLVLYKNELGNGAAHFATGELLQYDAKRPCFSYKTDGSPVFVDEDGYLYTELSYRGLQNGKIINGLTRSYKLYDIDGDGLSDAVFPVNKSTGEYHNGIPYDENGKSLQYAESGLAWIKNTGSESAPVFDSGRRNVLDSKGKVFKVTDEMQYTYFRSISMFDWDGDGDLDLIAGGWQNVFYYYENKGNKHEPIFDTAGVLIETETGVLRLDVCRYNIINYDNSGDGFDDLFIGTESGTTKHLVFKGFNKETGAPVFSDKGYMMTDAEHLWVNALSRPTACDFDGDGDTDFIVGDNCGLFWFYENLTGGESPSFAYPVKMKDENGNILVIKGGYNGSFQGTTECEWGYSVPVACDWDGDGDFDIVANSINGRIVWFENIGTKFHGQLTQPKPVEVEWKNGAKYPSSIWYKPSGKELITQHRTTPYAVDFNGDGLCDIVMLDHEGYLAFYERYEENGVLKLKEGDRIFLCNGEPLRLTAKEFGKSGRIKFVVVDWDGDGLLDVIVGEKTMLFYKNLGTIGKICFLESKGALSDGNISGHNHGFTVVDFNGDGAPDLVSGSESGYFYYLENNK